MSHRLINGEIQPKFSGLSWSRTPQLCCLSVKILQVSHPQRNTAFL